MRSGYYGRYVLPVIKLLLVKDQKIEHKELNFGAMCIMESMADMLERKAYGRSKLGEYPQYDICEKLWAYFFKDNHDNELLFRLCEYALMGENPGQDFYCAISAMREMGSIDKEFIDNFFENSFNIHYGKRYKEWHEQMMSFSNEIIKKDNIYMKRLLLGLLKESEACPLGQFREPMAYEITVKTGYNTSKLKKDGIKVYTVKKELHGDGIVMMQTPFGHSVPVYNMERSLCDIIRNRNNTEIQTALKQYAKRKDKDLRLLMQYAAKFRVDKILRQYLEVLL